MRKKIIPFLIFASAFSLALFARADAPYFYAVDTTFNGVGLLGNCSGSTGETNIYVFNASGTNVSGNAQGTALQFSTGCPAGNFTRDWITDLGQGALSSGIYTVVAVTGNGATVLNNFADPACGAGQTTSGCQTNWGYSPDSNSAASISYQWNEGGGGGGGGGSSSTPSSSPFLAPMNNTTSTINVSSYVFNEMVNLPVYIFQHYESQLVWMAIIICLVTAIFSVLKIIGLI